MDSSSLVFNAGYALGVIRGIALSLYLQYIVIKYAVYAGIKRWSDSQDIDRKHQAIREGVSAGLMGYDNLKKDIKKG